MEAVGIGIFFLGFFALWLFALVFWIMTIVEVVKLPDHQYKAAGTDKVVWVLVVVLAGVIGALIWRFAKRNDVLAAVGRMPAAAPGWYPDPVTGVPRWWDGTNWAAASPPPPG